MAFPKPSEYAIQRAIVMNRADAEVLAALRQAQEDVHRMLREVAARPGVGAALRKAQLQLIKRNVQQEMANLWRKVGDITQAKRLESANKLIDLNEVSDRLRLVTAGVPGGADIARAIADAERDAAERAMDRMTARVQGASHKPLADQVYTSQTGLNGQLDRMLNSALATGLSAREFAATIQNFINPNTPGGARYAALRTARTEINNAAHAVAIDAVQDKPWVDSMKWNLSGSHKRADICNSLAGGGPKNDGNYPKGSVPAKPHPQCFCYVTPNTLDDDEFMDGLLSGKFDGYLEKYKNLQPGQVVRSNFPGGSAGQVAPVSQPTKKAKPAETPKPIAPSVRKPPAPSVPKATPPPPPVRAVGRATPGALLSQPVVRIADAGPKAVIEKEFSHQARLAPNAAKSLKSVQYADESHFALGVSRDALGIYLRSQDRILLNRSIFDDRYAKVYQREITSNWATPCGHDHTAPGAVFAHEFGHHVDWVMRAAPYEGKKRLWDAVADGMGVPKAEGLSAGQLDPWVKRHYAQASSSVSRYGATNSAELLAEIWQEFSTNPNARPFIKRIGQIMLDLSEAAT